MRISGRGRSMYLHVNEKYASVRGSGKIGGNSMCDRESK